MTRANQQRKLEAERKRDADLKKQKERLEMRRKELEKEEMEDALADPEELRTRKDRSIRWIYETPASYASAETKDESKDKKESEDPQTQEKKPDKEEKTSNQIATLQKRFEFLKGMPKSRFGEDDTILRHYPLGLEV